MENLRKFREPLNVFDPRNLLRLLSRELLRNLRAGGYDTLRGTFVEDENTASSSQADRMGGMPLHGVTFYRREVV